MALWVVRGGRHGEHEQKFLEENRVFLTWKGLKKDLGLAQDRAGIREILAETYPDFGDGKLTNHMGQIWAFSHRIEKGDWVILPSKHKSAIHIAEVTGGYEFHEDAEDPYFHSMKVKWIATDIPRSNFSQDLLYSFGAFMTVCEVQRNDAENRVRQMQTKGWASSPVVVPSDSEASDAAAITHPNLEQDARDLISRFIEANFMGHGLARIVDAVLRAQGYTTHVSPPGPDGGIDILAAPGPLGFGHPRICVQVKSGTSPLDRPTLDQLVGVMQNIQAEQGLLVSWGGFKTSVDRETANQFFRVRLWDQDDLIDKLLAHYDEVDEDLRAELPLKRIWTVASSAFED